MLSVPMALDLYPLAHVSAAEAKMMQVTATGLLPKLPEEPDL